MLTGVLLAGGRSERMGRDKLGLVFDGETLLTRAVRRLAACADEVLIVGREATVEAAVGVPVRAVLDRLPGHGALGGLLTGLEAARGDRCLVVAGDMPFLNVELLRWLAGALGEADAVVPEIDGRVEPLHACYHVRCAAAIRRQLASGRRQMIGFFDDIAIRFVERADLERLDPRLLSFVNVNTPAELADVLALAAAGGTYTPQGQRYRRPTEVADAPGH